MPINLGFNSRLSLGLSGACAYLLHTKTSILIGLFSTIVILNTLPSMVLQLVAVLGSILYLYFLNYLWWSLFSFFFLNLSLACSPVHSECTMCNFHLTLITPVLVCVLFSEMNSYRLRYWDNVLLLQEFLITYLHF